jgi:hypothetical protein
MFRKFDKPTEYKEQVYDNETNSYIEMKGMIVGILDDKYKVLNEFEPIMVNKTETKGSK